MKVWLCALTGFGNAVLSRLLDISFVGEVVVLTRRETGPFPYYDCEELFIVCRRSGVPVYSYPEMDFAQIQASLKAFDPDIILVATFHKKIPEEIASIPCLGAVNIHPSLLPLYRGPTPTHWSIINGDVETGITFHELVQDIDMGPILFQRKTTIDRLDDGELRRKLALLAADMLEPFLSNLKKGSIRKFPQAKGEGSYYPKITSAEGLNLLKCGRFDPDHIVRGLTPYPGPGILENPQVLCPGSNL